MEAWRKGREFVRMLEYKQDILQSDIVKTKNRLIQIRARIVEYQQESAFVNQQIKMLTPSGILSRADIYKGIRKQGALLTHQQSVIHKISQLESEQHQQEQKLQQFRATMSKLDKKHHKLSHYLQPLRREYMQRCDNNAENEIQEIAVYGRENF